MLIQESGWLVQQQEVILSQAEREMLRDRGGGLSFVREQLGPKDVTLGRSSRWNWTGLRIVCRTTETWDVGMRDQMHIFVRNSAHLLQTRASV